MLEQTPWGLLLYAVFLVALGMSLVDISRWLRRKLVNHLIERAKRTPYFHLDGYMNRWWLVPYERVEKYKPILQFSNGYAQIEGDTGTGPVDPWRRPIARLLQKRGIAARIHEILRSDRGRHPHNHPWWYITIILRGWYTEIRYDDKGNVTSRKLHGPGSILFRPAGSWHMLKLINFSSDPSAPDEPVTTLFITGRKSQSWGYNVDGAQVNHLDYDGRM